MSCQRTLCCRTFGGVSNGNSLPSASTFDGSVFPILKSLFVSNSSTSLPLHPPLQLPCGSPRGNTAAVLHTLARKNYAQTIVSTPALTTRSQCNSRCRRKKKRILFLLSATTARSQSASVPSNRTSRRSRTPCHFQQEASTILPGSVVVFRRMSVLGWFQQPLRERVCGLGTRTEWRCGER